MKCKFCKSVKVVLTDKTTAKGNKITKCECSDCGMLWLASKKQPRKVTRTIKLTQQEAVAGIKQGVHKDIEVDYSFKYVNYSTRNIKCRCKVDGHQWLASYMGLSAGVACQKCVGTLRLSQSTAEKRLKENMHHDVKIAEPFVYKNTKTKNIKCICSRGHQWVSTYAIQVQGFGCKECRYIIGEDE